MSAGGGSASDLEPVPRSTAAIVGALFLVATGLFVVGQFLTAPILGSPDYLRVAFPESTPVVAGILIELVAVLAIPLIALALYPVLRRHDEIAALGYVGLRILEAAALLLVEVINWATVQWSRSYVEGGTATGPTWEVVARAFRAVSESAFTLSVAVIFPCGALLLNHVLWRAKLVPRFISGWGLAAGALLLAGSVLVFFDLLPAAPSEGVEAALPAPIAIQEMVLALWLIAKGFGA
jgi:hypothetical protein